METGVLKIFAQKMRRVLVQQILFKLDCVMSSTADTFKSVYNAEALKKLKNQIKYTSKELVAERIAYIWFNRLCALRYMDIKHYTFIGVVSPAEGNTQPEILQKAKDRHIDAVLDKFVNKEKVFDLLSGTVISKDFQAEAYRMLIVAVCNYYHTIMPFMFEKIEDYTEILMPDDLLSDNSILHSIREAMTPENCSDVEVIGWLYQFYISEKKADVIKGLKKNIKISPENIPYATQLFTPNWIVRFIVQNSLGKLWLLNNPDSKLAERMEYYIKPQQEETDFLKITSPEEIKLCDPACGSGHIMVYAFELLYHIYEECGYNQNDISKTIIKNNLFGIDIDEQAGKLAYFSLYMKGREKDKQFFTRETQPNICILENISFTKKELKTYVVQTQFIASQFQSTISDSTQNKNFSINENDKQKTINSISTLMKQFGNAKNFGSLIRPIVEGAGEIYNMLEKKDFDDDTFIKQIHLKIMQLYKQAYYLSQKYYVVLANPPYIGNKGMNNEMRYFLEKNYEDAKHDLFASFIIRNTELTLKNGEIGMITPYVWMFISFYKKLRDYLLTKTTLTTLVQLEYNAFESACIPVCAFTLKNNHNPNYKGSFIKLSDFKGYKNQASKTLEAIKNKNCGWFYTSSSNDFKKIHGSIIAYWISDKVKHIFENYKKLGDLVFAKVGLQTGNNDIFVRRWFEVKYSKIGFNFKSRAEALNSKLKWFPYNKGGQFRKWYGNQEFIVNWENDGKEIINFFNIEGKLKSRKQNIDFYFKESISWSDITSGINAFRYYPAGFIYDVKGQSAFANDSTTKEQLLALCNNKFISIVSKVINPTMSFQVGNFNLLPAVLLNHSYIKDLINEVINISKSDWDSYETSWNFTELPLLKKDFKNTDLSVAYTSLLSSWEKMTSDMKKLEEKNNKIFIETYKLEDELSSDIPIEEITLTCNPYYRYCGKKTEKDLDALLLADTIKEFISYAVGCMFGRYSIDKPGLILANQGEDIKDYLEQIPNPSFMPDDDNVISILDNNCFPDDITERFKKFLKKVFGDEYYDDNLSFIERAIGKDIRRFFMQDFYDYHVKMYQKRPIYWLFSSPQGSFKSLIYMHRYKNSTVSTMLNKYLRKYKKKQSSHLKYLKKLSVNSEISQKEKTESLKEIERIKKVIKELNDYENKIINPLAIQKIEIDLDDGVKVNYAKFGKALKKIPGLVE